METQTPDYYYFETQNTTDFSFDNEGCSITSFHGSHIFLPLIYYLIFFTGFWGNIFVISVVLTKGKRSGRLVDTFVVNLALADLIFVVTLPLWAISASQDNIWDFGLASDLLCRLSSYVISVNRFSNIFFLTCMSIDRYLAIVKMMDSKYLRSSGCIRATCVILWSVSLVLGVPSLIYRKVDDNKYCTENTSSAFFLGMSLMMVLLTFVFPVLIIILCYGTIIMHLNKHCSAAGNPRANARRRHSLKMVLCIIVVFVVSWLPYNIFKSITIMSKLSKADLSCDVSSLQYNGLRISCCLAFLNSCMNPVIYFFLDHHFRRQAGALYQGCAGKQKLLQGFNSSASFTNGGTTESYATSGGRTHLKMLQ
ncbi:unnamed protein product [Menidia menidia]|uniref:(Atlantic silverside) hypothetical protein n=1 Tax=Menidia menidia TaxID=238744 RepID=A0A8S4BGD8_9TELE|nr:unnamed protein product [Menidia menidia]